MSETIEKNEKEIEKVTIERCNIFCREYLGHLETTILPSEWRCRYHRFLQSLEMRKSSVKRPRLVIEVDSDKTVAIIVAIGERYTSKAVLPDDLEYIVIRKTDSGFPTVYDKRTNKIYEINSISDEAVIESRLRYDFWLAVSRGEYYKIAKLKTYDYTKSVIVKANRNTWDELTTLMLVEKITGRKITQQ
jgi:hypothetical protein